VNPPLATEIAQALDSAEEPLRTAAEVVRRAFAVDRVSIARIDEHADRFEIAAEAGAELLAPGTALPVATCSYFATAAEGRAFHEEDFDAARGFQRPLDGVVLASGFHSGCSVPLHHEGRAVGALSLSAGAHRDDMTTCADRAQAVGDLLAERLLRPGRTAHPRVLVCHADPLSGRGIARLAELEAGARASIAATVADAVAAAGGSPPDLVVCDDFLDGLGVGDVVRALRDAGTDAPLVVVSSRDAPESLHAALEAGAAAYVPRRDAVRALPVALAAVHSGRTVLPEAPPDGAPRLTPRERELLRSLDEGLRFKQLARRLGISEATAKTHARNAFRKLGATSRAEAVHTARAQGVLA
jgi:DNA-binding NarL/FixJ family response regulator